MTIQQQSKYEDQILDIIECQVRNDDNSMTQSDLQAVVSAIVRNIAYQEVSRKLSQGYHL